MKLIVGLGNPGRKYEGTRHNIGFVVVEELAKRHAAGRAKAAFDGEVAEATIDGERVYLLRPHTLMNRSGMSVVKARDFYKLELNDLLIVCDDFHLPLARLRFRAKGSSGGQKGLGDIIQKLGTQELGRLRVGVGEPPANWDPADYVLGRFAKQELPAIEEATWRAADAADDWIRRGIAYCMNQYNSVKDETDE